MIILGLDPGSERTGYGVVGVQGRKVERIDHGVVRVSDRLALCDRLYRIHDAVRLLIEEHRPVVVAVESIFHSHNARSALVLGHARGVILLAAAQSQIPVREYSPATVKAQVCGNGRAEKSQVAFMVTRHLALAADLPPGDAADALAVALCGAWAPPGEVAE